VRLDEEAKGLGVAALHLSIQARSCAAAFGEESLGTSVAGMAGL